MDDVWERSMPMVCIDRLQMQALLRAWNPQAQWQAQRAVDIGCRNSNYWVQTSKGNVFIRIGLEDDASWQNEQAVFHALHGTVSMPALLATVPFGRRMALLYEAIEGESLIRVQAKGFSNAVLEQVACQATLIHRHADIPGLCEPNYPPFEQWFSLFLSKPAARMRLGSARVARIEALLARQAEALRAIGAFRAFTHSDFRPANMLLDTAGRVYIVDWEGAGTGHALADIGQFFRYRTCFCAADYQRFESAYNAHAARPLPDDWQPLSRLRDLINPLQMIGTAQERPRQFQDLTALIDDTLAFFGA